jgi:DNA-binding MarR family transcriptional regulator
MSRPTPQPDLAACHCTALRKAARRVSLLYDRHLSAVGLTSGQFAVLTQLASWPSGCNPSLAELARSLVLDRTALTRALQPVLRDGLVQLVEHPQDRRMRLVHLTSAGRKRLIQASGRWAAAQAKYALAIGERQAVALRALSQSVAEVELDP